MKVGTGFIRLPCVLGSLSTIRALNVVKESITLASGWHVAGLPDPSQNLRLQIGLARPNFEGLTTKLLDLANPNSPNYRDWITQQEIEVYTAPAPQAVAAVKAWLISNGVAASAIKQPTVDWLNVDLPISQIEKLLSTKYSLISHELLSQPLPRALTYSLPAALHDFIYTIQPTTAMFLPITPHLSKGNATLAQSQRFTKRDTTCDPSCVAPQCVRTYYAYDWRSGNRDGAQAGVFGRGGASHSDAQTFYAFTTPQTVPGGDFKDYTYSGPPNDGSSGLESAIDVQWAGAMANGNDVYYILSDQSADLFSSFGQYVSSDNSGAPPAISISWFNQESQLSLDYKKRICFDFVVAGVKGISILVASGDGGTQGLTNSCSRYEPLFPQTCPYVTTVGGTQFRSSKQFQTGGSNPDPGEDVAQYPNNGGSGGGFSNTFGMPDYQKADVQAYIKSLGGYQSGLYNASGRAYPDVAALGQNMFVVNGGKGINAYGTSVAAPIWAGLISLLNDIEISRGKKTLGFLNPALYGGNYRKALKDITNGVTGFAGCAPNLGFPAAKGWDAASGLGTPGEVVFRFYLP